MSAGRGREGGRGRAGAPPGGAGGRGLLSTGRGIPSPLGSDEDFQSLWNAFCAPNAPEHIRLSLFDLYETYPGVRTRVDSLPRPPGQELAFQDILIDSFCNVRTARAACITFVSHYEANESFRARVMQRYLDSRGLNLGMVNLQTEVLLELMIAALGYNGPDSEQDINDAIGTKLFLVDQACTDIVNARGPGPSRTEEVQFRDRLAELEAAQPPDVAARLARLRLKDPAQGARGGVGGRGPGRGGGGGREMGRAGAAGRGTGRGAGRGSAEAAQQDCSPRASGQARGTGGTASAARAPREGSAERSSSGQAQRQRRGGLGSVAGFRGMFDRGKPK